MRKIFDSACRSASDLCGVFEYDGTSGYFYLYDQSQPDGGKILGYIHVLSHPPDFLAKHVAIDWTGDEQLVGLFIRKELWAAFDTATGARIGGDYRAGAAPQVPSDILSRFTLH